MNKLTEAIQIATTFHKGQYRWDGSPYILHPTRVLNSLLSNGITDEDILCSAVLHDVVEDTEVTIEEIIEWFWEWVGEIVSLLTHDKGEDYSLYIEKIKENKSATLIKLADIEDNCSISSQSKSWASDKKKAERHLKYLKAYNYLKKWLNVLSKN